MKEIWNKKMDELTFGDNVKIQLAAVSLAAGALAGYVGAVAAVRAVKNRRSSDETTEQAEIIDAEVVED